MGIESRGFLLGGPAAVELGLGFVAVRKAGSPFPGPKLSAVSATDYRGRRSEFLLQRAAVSPGDRLLLVDDWVETGSSATAVASLVTAAGGQLVALAVLVDQLSDPARDRLPPVHALVGAAELPPV